MNMNRMNNHKLYKAIALVLLFSIALSVASCGAKEQGGKAKKISSDSPWYDAEVIPFKLETKKNKVVYGLNYYLLGADDKYIAVYSNGAYDVAQWTDDVKYEDWLISFVTLIDRTTKKTVKSINLLDYLGRYEYPWNASYCNGKVIVFVETDDITTGITVYKEIEIDADTGKLLNVRELSPDGEPLTSNVRVYSFVVGEYRIIPEKKKSADDNFCILNIVMPDGSLKEVELKDPSGNIYGVPFVLAIDDTTALIPASKEMNNKYYKLDLKTITLSPADEEYSWLDDEFFYYLSSFFQKFFPIKRRGLLTPAEMKMCGYFLKWFGLSAEVVTESRLRQFRMKFDVVNIGNISMLPINGEDVPFQWEFVKYKDWKNGKINPLKHEIEHLQEGDSIIFPPDVAGLDLLKR